MVYLSNLYVAIFTQYLTDLQQTDEHWMEWMETTKKSRMMTVNKST
jgi:hypothetical protein